MTSTKTARARRALAALVFVACAGHIWMVLSGAQGPLLTALYLAMAAICAPCAIRLWERDNSHLLALIGLMAAAMMATHLVIMASSAFMPGTAAGMPGLAASGGSGNLAMLATTALEALVILGVTGLVLTTRPTSSPGRQRRHR